MNEHRASCVTCKYNNFDGTCTAFPEQIPLYISSGQIPHERPVNGQNNDIVYEWISPSAQKLKLRKILLESGRRSVTTHS
jgi:hypothetical protein